MKRLSNRAIGYSDLFLLIDDGWLKQARKCNGIPTGYIYSLERLNYDTDVICQIAAAAVTIGARQIFSSTLQ